MGQVEENLKIAMNNSPFSDEELDLIGDHLQKLKKMADLYCTGCNYCTPCPKDVAIPKIFERYNRGRVYGLWEDAKKAYADIGKVQWDKGNKADACVKCGICEDKCPQKIPIRRMLAEAHKRLS